MGFEDHVQNRTAEEIIPEADRNEFRQFEQEGNAHAIESEELKEKADKLRKARNAAITGAGLGVVGVVAQVATLQGPLALFAAGVTGVSASAAYQAHSAMKNEQSRQKEEDASYEEKFAKARDLIDVEAARKVAEADGVKIVRPEDVK